MAVPNIEKFIESVKQSIFREMTSLVFRIRGAK